MLRNFILKIILTIKFSSMLSGRIFQNEKFKNTILFFFAIFLFSCCIFNSPYGTYFDLKLRDSARTPKLCWTLWEICRDSATVTTQLLTKLLLAIHIVHDTKTSLSWPNKPFCRLTRKKIIIAYELLSWAQLIYRAIGKTLWSLPGGEKKCFTKDVLISAAQSAVKS